MIKIVLEYLKKRRIRKRIRQICKGVLQTSARREDTPFEYLVMLTINRLELYYDYREGVDFTIEAVRQIVDEFTWEYFNPGKKRNF